MPIVDALRDGKHRGETPPLSSRAGRMFSSVRMPAMACECANVTGGSVLAMGDAIRLLPIARKPVRGPLGAPAAARLATLATLATANNVTAKAVAAA